MMRLGWWVACGLAFISLLFNQPAEAYIAAMLVIAELDKP